MSIFVSQTTEYVLHPGTSEIWIYSISDPRPHSTYKEKPRKPRPQVARSHQASPAHLDGITDGPHRLLPHAPPHAPFLHIPQPSSHVLGDAAAVARSPGECQSLPADAQEQRQRGEQHEQHEQGDELGRGKSAIEVGPQRRAEEGEDAW